MHKRGLTNLQQYSLSRRVIGPIVLVIKNKIKIKQERKQKKREKESHTLGRGASPRVVPPLIHDHSQHALKPRKFKINIYMKI